MRSGRHRADYARRLEGVGELVREQIGRMREGMSAGRVVPRVVLGATLGPVRSFGRAGLAGGVEASAFYRPFVGLPAGDESASRARRAIEGPIAGAFDELAEFLEREYIPACRDSIAAGDSVDGAEWYAQRVRAHTTLALSAEEVHRLGRREVARLREEMDAAIDETDWAGRKLPRGDERLAAFLAFLREDKRFYYNNAGAMLDDYRALGKRLDPALLALFADSPRLPWGVRAIPAFASESSPAAYCYPGSMRSGVPGYFMVNVGALDQRPRYGMVSLTLHEAVPGHHFQLALADEMEGVHRLRTMVEFTAYVEGWALYAESLGLELGGGDEERPGAPLSVGGDGSGVRTPARGFYADPYDNFGRLSDEIWRASRLVVDTGMHALGWDRGRAIEYMLANTAGTRVDIESEVDRYISWPGQALAYKVGELRIRAMRARAERELGDRFDVRAFHGVVLGAGCLPMEVLDRRVDRWIARAKG